MSKLPRVHAGSFRDPSGFIFIEDGVVYRQINLSYRTTFEQLMNSGLYNELVQKKLLIPHEDAANSDCSGLGNPGNPGYKVIRPTRIPFISYPSEWCFGELRAAALSTLDIAEAALRFGLTLKDASAYNIQFVDGHPLLIDTLSFEEYQEGRPWAAYRQFCQHFLNPLLLARYCDPAFIRLSQSYIDGIPLELTSKLLPFLTRLRPGIFLHVHLHARSQKRYAAASVAQGAESKLRFGRRSFLGLIDGLRSLITSLRWRSEATTWRDYYAKTNYSDTAMQAKEELVADFLKSVDPASVWDLGANTGRFSRLAAGLGARVLSFDFDLAAVEANFQVCQKDSLERILPLVFDLANPSRAVGWANAERQTLAERGPADLVLALALVHHLAISNNVPLHRIAGCFAELGRALIIEFIPASDSQVQKLLHGRENIFPDYTLPAFEAAFLPYFDLNRKESIKGSERTLYLFTRRA